MKFIFVLFLLCFTLLCNAQSKYSLENKTMKLIQDVSLFQNGDTTILMFSRAFVKDFKKESETYLRDESLFSKKTRNQILSKHEELRNYEWKCPLTKGMKFVKKSFLDSVYKVHPLFSNRVVDSFYKRGFYSLSPVFYNNDLCCLLFFDHSYGGGELQLYQRTNKAERWALVKKLTEWVY